MKPLPFPAEVSAKMRQAAALAAECSNLMPRCGPMGPRDKLLSFAVKSEFGNCSVTVTVERKTTPTT